MNFFTKSEKFWKIIKRKLLGSNFYLINHSFNHVFVRKRTCYSHKIKNPKIRL